jgi:hypothetical protein
LHKIFFNGGKDSPMLKQKNFLEKYYNNILEKDALKNIYATENKDCEPLF